MGNVESGPDGSFGPVDSLKHRLQSLEETIRSIEVGATQEHAQRLAKDSPVFICLYVYYTARRSQYPGTTIFAI